MRCEECGEEFEDILDLGRHIRNVHIRGSRRQDKTKPPEATDKALPCPTCGFGSKPGEPVLNDALTVCPRCLCWYHTGNGKMDQPPPEKCIYEKSGEPCPIPAHQYWHKMYMGG